MSSSYSTKLDEFERVAVEVAKEAGKLIKQTWGTCKSVEAKQSFADLVTETDKNVEKLVFEELKFRFPEHKFIGEESVAEDSYSNVELTDQPTWIVDPVDGR